MSENKEKQFAWVQSRLERIQAKLHAGEINELLASRMALCIMLEFTIPEEEGTHGEVTQEV